MQEGCPPAWSARLAPMHGLLQDHMCRYTHIFDARARARRATLLRFCASYSYFVVYTHIFILLYPNSDFSDAGSITPGQRNSGCGILTIPKQVRIGRVFRV